jgi:cytochrome c553
VIVRRAYVAAALLAATVAMPARAGDAARGKAMAEERGCNGCHGGETGAAMPNIPSLAGQPPDFQVLQLILFRERLRNAPPMPDLVQGMTDDEFENLATYFAGIKRVPPEDLGARDEALVGRGQALSQQMRCGVCHLPDYRGREQIPRLAGQREDYLLRTLREYRDNKRVGTDTSMNAVVYAVPDADLSALAHYLAHVP